MHAASSRKPLWRRVAGSPPSLVAAAGFTGQASTPWPERQGWPGPRPMDKASVDTATPCPGRACWSGSPSPHHVSPWMLGRDAVLGDRHPDTPPLLWGYPPTGPRTPTQEASRSAAEGRGGEAHGSPHPEVPAKTRDASWTPSVGRGPSLPCVCGRSAPAPGSREPQPQRGLAADRPPGAAPWCPTNYFGRRRQFSHEPGASR